MLEPSVSRNHVIYIGLGANIGDREETLRAAIDELKSLDAGQGVRVSPLYVTVPQEADGPNYLNAVAELRTLLGPHDVLKSLLRIEALHGRERPYANAPRTLDLDLLMYDAIRLTTKSLVLPHPRMHMRAFVLQPLCDLVPDLEIKGLGRIASLLRGLPEQGVYLASGALLPSRASA